MRSEDSAIKSIIERLIAYLLVVVHLALTAWSVLGLAELAWNNAPWPRLSNPLFPPGLLVAHGSAILMGGLVFTVGYALRSPRLPVLMTIAYGAMAAVCAVETTGYLVHAARYVDMALEYATYAVILLYLFRSGAPRLRHRS